MSEIGKGIGTIGIWGAIAYVGSIEPESVIATGLFGMVATIAIWVK